MVQHVLSSRQIMMQLFVEYYCSKMKHHNHITDCSHVYICEQLRPK